MTIITSLGNKIIWSSRLQSNFKIIMIDTLLNDMFPVDWFTPYNDSN